MTSEGKSEVKVNIVKQRSHSQTFSRDSHTGGRGNRGPNKYTVSSSRGKQGPPVIQGIGVNHTAIGFFPAFFPKHPAFVGFFVRKKS